MLRKTYAFVCALFALMFVLGFQSTSRAAVVSASGGFFGADNTSVAFLVRGSDVSQFGQVSLTTGAAHYYATINNLAISSTNVTWNASVTVQGVTTVISGSLSRPDTSSAWTVNYTVSINGGVISAYTSAFRGQVLIN